MKYSVIIPVYNVEDKLERCVNSLLQQVYSDYEIILVNDGSKDNSGALCRKYAEAYDNIVYIEKENGGASSARNAGLDHADGEYVLFVDSDDYVLDNFFAEIDGKECNNGLAVFTYVLKKVGKEYVRPIPERLTDTHADYFTKVSGLILSRTINSPCAKVFSKKLIDSCHLRFDEKMPVAEDFIFCTDYLIHTREVGVYQKPIYYYDNTNASSLTQGTKRNLIDVYPYVFDTAFRIVANADRFTDEQKAELNRIIDKLHTDSFITCVMETLKEDQKSSAQKKREIRKMCRKFYDRYPAIYGFCGRIHFFVRMCIKYKLANTLYYSSKLYSKMRG